MNKNEMFPIGIGTWKINLDNIENDLKALEYSLEKGQNYISLYMLYENGEVVKALSSFVNKNRERLFINVNLEPTIKQISDVEKQLDEYLEILGLSFIDSIQLHSPLFSEIPLVDVYKEISRLVEIGKVRYIGVSNVNLEQLKQINSKVKLDFFEGVYNLECKIYENIGVLDYCKENNIQFVCYQPLRRNRTALQNYPVLVELANKYNKTQNQIILNWIVKKKNILPLIKSTNMSRIEENLLSLNFEMEDSDYNKLNNFRSESFDNIEIDWQGNGGITIDQLANQEVK